MDECRDEGMNTWRAEKTSIQSPAESYIEWRFECRCEELANGNDILTEWRERKRQYKSWTDTIAYDFQHFSRHDASHSINILEAIEMLLGKERIDKLSAGDLWLLLECAYQHDIGMAITYEELIALWRNPKFKNHIEKRIYSELADERKAALFYYQLDQLIRDEKNISAIENGQFTRTKMDAEWLDEDGIPWEVYIQKCLMYLVSSYIRKGHADRILKLDERIKIPENSVIPERLYIVARVASRLHGESDYEEIIKQLKECTKGFGNGRVHPRFICAMLRVGDVLDLENNRFNIRAIQHFGDLPYQSQLHLEKHKAITHIKITPMQVEVEARSEDMDVCKVLSDDFRWIEDEIKNLICYWNVMSPIELGGCTLQQGKGSIYLGDSERCYDSSYERRVEMDRENLMPLFMGDNIYKDSFEFIREYLQNALDATKMQLWLDIKKNKTHRKQNPEVYDKSEISPLDLSSDLYEQYPIEVTYKVDMRERIVRLGIRDYGIGIERECKGMITNIGRGWKERSGYSEELKNMPDWLRPTGGFGIGMQSAFMVTDKIEIYTHSNKDAEGYKMTIDSPQKGSHVITEDYEIEERGTKVCVDIPLDEFLIWNYKWWKKSMQYNGRKDEEDELPGVVEFYEASARAGDFFNVNAVSNYIGGFLESFIRAKVNHRLFPIYISTENLNDREIPINFLPRINYWNYEQTSKQKNSKIYVLKDKEGIACFDVLRMSYYGWIRKDKILYRVTLGTSSEKLNGITYKNVSVSEKGHLPYKEHLKLYMDLLGGDVKHLLKVSRNEFLDGVTTEKWELAAIQHFFQVMNCWRQQEKKGMYESTDFIERRYWEKPYYYLYQSIYGSHDWESITERDGDPEVPMVTGEVFRLDEPDWMKEKTAVRFYDVYRQIRALLEGDANAKMVFRIGVSGKKQNYSAVRLSRTKDDILKNSTTDSNQFSQDNVNRFSLEGNLFVDDEDLFRMIIGTKKVQIDYFEIRGFGENPTLYAWLTPKKKKRFEFSEVKFYVNSWNNSLINGRYCYEVHDAVFLQKLQVKHLPYDIDTQNIDESRRWIISPVNADQVIKCTNMGRKVLWQEFYDMVVSDEAYVVLIQWVADHQSEERKYSKKEIHEAYREYLEEIYKYNLSEGTEGSR